MKKKISGQTIAIIVLAVLLLLVLAFGSVYAIYNTNTDKITGRIIMANLAIEFEDTSGSTGSSDVWFTSDRPVVPNEVIGNTPLNIINSSNTPIFIVLFYKLDVTKMKDGSAVDYDLSKQVLDVGADGTNGWLDYYINNTYQSKTLEGRCLVMYVPSSSERITAIAENSLKLYYKVGSDDYGDDFQDCSIRFTFQAYAIAANSFDDDTEFATDSPLEKSEKIVLKIIHNHNNNLAIYE